MSDFRGAVRGAGGPNIVLPRSGPGLIDGWRLPGMTLNGRVYLAFNAPCRFGLFVVFSGGAAGDPSAG
jgi:hypothetical protein